MAQASTDRRRGFPLAEQASLDEDQDLREDMEHDDGCKEPVMPIKHLSLYKYYIIKHDEYSVICVCYIYIYISIIEGFIVLLK